MNRVWPECPGSRRIPGSWKAGMWMLLLPCLKGGPGATGWSMFSDYRRKDVAISTPVGVSDPRRCGAGCQSARD